MGILFLIVFFFVSFLIVGLVLLQEGKGGGLTGMSTGMDGVMGAKNPLRRMTAYLFVVFVLMAVSINWYFHDRSRSASTLPAGAVLPVSNVRTLETTVPAAPVESAAPAVPAEAAAPAAPVAAPAESVTPPAPAESVVPPPPAAPVAAPAESVTPPAEAEALRPAAAPAAPVAPPAPAPAASAEPTTPESAPAATE